MNAKIEATVVPSETEQPEPILIRGPRELKWVGDHYELVEVTPEQIEQTRRREQYVAMFNPCGL